MHKVIKVLVCLQVLFIYNPSFAQNTKAEIEGTTSIKTTNEGYGFAVDISGDYLFAFDQDTLSKESIIALETVLSTYKKFGGFKIDITGHTDSKGSENYNQELSERRANRVFDWFKSQGITESSLTAKGLGESQPVAANEIDGVDYPQGRARNRRVEISTQTTEKVTSLPSTAEVEPVEPPQPKKIDSISAPKPKKITPVAPPKPKKVTSINRQG